MKLDQLTYFLELARTQHVGQASKKLRLSPSAVSHALGQLEDELGAQLFDRIGRGLVLNDTGRRLAARAEALLGEVSRLKDEVSPLAGGLRGHFRLAAPHSLATDWLSRAWASLARQHPGLSATMACLGSRTVIDLLLTGELDLGMTFGVGPETVSKLEKATVYQGRLCLCVRRDHPVFASAAPTEALPRYPLAMPLGFQAEDMQDDPVLARFAAFHRTVAFGFDSYDVAAAYLSETDAVSILPDLALRTRGDRLTAVAVPGFDRTFEVVMLWPKARAGHPVVASALAEARRVVATA